MYIGGHLLGNCALLAILIIFYRPPRREGHEIGQRQQDNRPAHHRKGERAQRGERTGHHEQDSEGSRGEMEDRRGGATKTEIDNKPPPPSAEQQKDGHPSTVGDGESGRYDHRTEHGAPPTRERSDRPPPRDDDHWHKNRSERHPPANERGHPPANERGRGGSRRGGDHERRSGPPPSADRQERGGAKDRERERERGSGKEGTGNRERKTSGQHDDGDGKVGRGGRRHPQPPPTASFKDESRGAPPPPPRSGRGPPLLPNPPGPPALLASTDMMQFPTDSHSQREPRAHHQLPTNQHEPTRGGRQSQHQSKKPSHEVKGHPDHGYGEVFDIESGEDWENEDNETETTAVAVASSSSGGGRGRRETHGETERGGGGGGPRRGEGQRGGKPQPPSSQGRGGRDEPRNQRNREERRHGREEGEGGRRDGRRGKGGRGGEEIPPRHAGQRKAQLQAERKTEDSDSKFNYSYS